MKAQYIAGIGIVIVVIIVTAILFNSPRESGIDQRNTKDTSSKSADQYKIDAYGIAFDVAMGPDAYVVEDLSRFIREQPEGEEILAVYRVINAKQKIELEESEGGREGPPTFSLMIWSNDQKLTASQWVDAYPLYSNTSFAFGEVDRDAVVGGANAVRYRADGLYQSDNVVIAHGGYMYIFNGSFSEQGDVYHEDFKNLIDSVMFFPSTEQAVIDMKIDIQVACESALAYSTFSSGEEADAFIFECIAGEHPEVIDRYISDLGIDGASI